MASLPAQIQKCVKWHVCFEVLEVLTQDPDVAASITMIVNRSQDTLINQQKEGNVYRFSIQKG